MKLAYLLLSVAAVACSHSKSAQSSDPRTAAAIAGAQPASAGGYACFTYSSGGAEHKHATCTTSSECQGVKDQVKGMSGMSDVTECAVATTVWCFHGRTNDGAQSGDVCQPSAEDCAETRNDAIAAKQPIDGACMQK